MIVFNLACQRGHEFEGWFSSGEQFDHQRDHGLVSCPLCGANEIDKRLSAPRLNVGKNALQGTATARPDVARGDHQSYWGNEQMLLAQFKRFIVQNTENVGSEFAERARRMHYGEESHRNIRGRVTREESEALRDEGIETMTIPGGIMHDEGLQ